MKYWNAQPNASLPRAVARQAQRAIRQLRLNRLTAMASYQAFIGQITSPICPHCGSGEETAEHLLLSCGAQGGQQNVSVISATALTSKMYFRTM